MKLKKRTLTLLEIMIVIFLISLITGAIGYSMKGTLDKGRAFRTQQGIELLHDLMLMCVAENEKIEQVANDPVWFISKHGLAKNPKKLIEDGWGNQFTIKLNRSKTDFKITSQAFDDYENRKNSKTANQRPQLKNL